MKSQYDYLNKYVEKQFKKSVSSLQSVHEHAYSKNLQILKFVLSNCHVKISLFYTASHEIFEVLLYSLEMQHLKNDAIASIQSSFDLTHLTFHMIKIQAKQK